MPNQPVEEGDDNVQAGVKQPTGHAFADAPRDSAIEVTVPHVGESDFVKCVVCCHDYTPKDYTVEPPEHKSKLFMARPGRGIQDRDVFQPRSGQADVKNKWKVPE